MPSLDFVLPHWLYWSGLVLFPLVAMMLVRREARLGPPGNASMPIALMLWLAGGFVGLHRFYLRSWLGVVYVVLFVAILMGNVEARDARLELSEARNEITKAEFLLERATERQGEDSEAAQQARSDLEATRQALEESQADAAWSDTVTGSIAALAAVLLLIDADLLPGMVRRYRERHGERPPTPVGGLERTVVPAVPDKPASLPGRFAWTVDRVSGWTGHFVAYWSVLAVFVYYYEVIARYVFNSPTNWAHESMFLMFGMVYLISGAFALRDDAHVRVDVLYQYLPRRGRAVVDIVTSIFFFIFVGTMLVTGIQFAMDSINVWEVSFTEWAIQYWVVKITIPLGAALLLLQGIADVLRNIAVFTGWDVPPPTVTTEASHHIT
ncbi:MAG: TRAP transporter small permease subunit [Halofilum sp. (in: g-proteobacteria)]|nr:TRAP transporter small permease subunit [Halofilum sp. (in: g-proteobacteria)]